MNDSDQRGPAGNTRPPDPAMPWVRRLGEALIRPLVRTPVTPNQLTTTSLVLAIAAFAGFASGVGAWMDLAAAAFIVSRVIDYMDGALARAKGMSSRFGERYDQTVDTVGYALMFVGVAVGLRNEVPLPWLVALAVAAVAGGVANTLVRARAEVRLRRSFPTFRAFAGFQLDDGIYLIGPATWLGFLPEFFVLVCVGAAAFGLWTCFSVAWRWRTRKSQRQ